jgi:hypothetical protein
MRIFFSDISFEVFIALIVQIMVFWVVTPYSLVSEEHDVPSSGLKMNTSILKMGQHVLPKRRYPPTRLPVVTTQNTTV